MKTIRGALSGSLIEGGAFGLWRYGDVLFHPIQEDPNP
jgi:hypothetical protein